MINLINFAWTERGKTDQRAKSFKLKVKPYCPSQHTDVWFNVKGDHVLNASQTFHRKRELLSYSKWMTSSAEILPSLKFNRSDLYQNSALRKF